MSDENKQAKNSNYQIEHFEPNVIAALSYLVPPFTGIIVYLLEKDNKFVKFHSFQSILFGVAMFVLMKAAQILRIIYIGALLEPVISVLGLLLWLNLMWKAYNNVEFELPYLGKTARKQVEK